LGVDSNRVNQPHSNPTGKPPLTTPSFTHTLSLPPQMSQPIQVDLLSDDDDALQTPLANHQKRPRIEFQTTPFLIIDDDPTPQKSLPSASSTPSFVPETPFSDLPKPQRPPIIRCAATYGSNPFSGSPDSVSLPKFAGGFVENSGLFGVMRSS